MMEMEYKQRPSLENVVEGEDLGLEILHPGGLEITRELAELCHTSESSKVLDVASGNGESTCYLAEKFDCEIKGVDISDYMIEKAKKKAKLKGLNMEFKNGSAHDLPFDVNTFDVVISECTTCLLDKERAIGEMVRVAKPGGYVGIHDICWKEQTPESLKQRLAENEGERTETLDGWKNIFERAGLIDIVTVDKSYLIPVWGKDIKKKLGIRGQFKIFIKVLRNWGLGGLKSIKESEQIFQSKHMGYGIIVGKKQ